MTIPPLSPTLTEVELELTEELWDAIDRHRGDLSLGEFIEKLAWYELDRLGLTKEGGVSA